MVELQLQKCLIAAFVLKHNIPTEKITAEIHHSIGGGNLLEEVGMLHQLIKHEERGTTIVDGLISKMISGCTSNPATNPY